MPTNASLYSYELPEHLIAQSPILPREKAKLMRVGRASGSIQHAAVGDFVHCLNPTDVVVINNTKVFHARLHGTIPGNKTVELFLVRSVPGGWLALGKPGKKLQNGIRVHIHDGFSAVVTQKHPDGTMTVDFGLPPETVISLANKYGSIPVPPYISREPKDAEYQTIYAKTTGSVAAPTAGFHISDAMMSAMRAKGIAIVEITLHVGLGTFAPIKSETLEDHKMHSEWVSVSKDAASQIMRKKHSGSRIVAIGTTTVRTLEGVAQIHGGKLNVYTGDVNLFIKPGFRFNIVDAMLTNFHLPKSTLLVLVSAFAGKELIQNAYKQAVDNSYRFYSFGDAMFIS